MKDLSQILELPADERLQIVEAIWDSLIEVPEAIPVSDAVLLSPSLLRDADRCDGERFLEFDRLGLAPARGGTDGVVRCFACSSAIRASMAPRMRCEALSQRKVQESIISIGVCTWKPWNMVVVCYGPRV